MTSEDPKITKFPDARRRRSMLLLHAANDGPREPMVNLPPVVKALCGCLIAVFILQRLLPYVFGAERAMTWIYDFAFVPARYAAGHALTWQAITSPVTYMFLHGGWLHMGVNLLSLMAFGAGLEKWAGGRRVLLVFFGAGLVGVAAQYFAEPLIENPVLGASGAISGLFGALLIEMQRRGHMGDGGLKRVLPFAAIWVLSSMVFGFLGMPGAEGAIAWAVHVGGFFGGMLVQFGATFTPKSTAIL
jgi:membrane associated rhomboid family serine protease